jgi:cytoskeletal protein CcmA (bactofilin family)
VTNESHAHEAPVALQSTPPTSRDSVSAVRVIGPGEEVDEHITVEDHLVVVSQVRGGVHVPAGTVLEVRGIVGGGITVDAGGRVVIYGTCDGGLTNDGDVDLYGTLMGGIHGGGRTRVSSGALVDGVRGRELGWELTPLTNEAAGEGRVQINHGMNFGDRSGVTVIGAELIETPVIVEGQLEIRGAAIAGARVLADAWLTVSGAVVGGLTVEPGGHVLINGSCVGGLVNDGEVDVFGVVFGGISGSGQTRVAPDATIDGVKGRDLGWESAAPSGS